MTNKARIVEIHYDMAGDGATISISRDFPNGRQTYRARGYKYTEKRAQRVILATPNDKWTTRHFYNPYTQLVTRK